MKLTKDEWLVVAAGLEMYYDQLVDECMEWGTTKGVEHIQDSVDRVAALINRVQEHIYDATK